jgi:hypothetical protein
MQDNNNITTDYGDMSSVELVDLLHQRDQQVANLTASIDSLGTENRKNVERIRAVVDKFRTALIDGDDVTIDDWDSLQEWFDDFDGIADLEPPVRMATFEVSMSTTKRFTVRITDPSLGESEIEDRLIDALDTYQRVDFLPSDLDGIEDIEDDDYSTDFEIDSTSLSIDD